MFQPIVDGQSISIHALRKESDPPFAVRLEPPINFNPRSP